MSPFRKLLLPLVLLSASAFLSSCGTNNITAPTPLADANFAGTWQFTSAPNSASPGITGFYGTLANSVGNGDSTSLTATGSLTLQGSCTEGATPIALTGTITNPHDINVQIDLTGAGNNGALTLSGYYVGDHNVLTGTYSINGGSCQVTSTDFTAQRMTPPPSS